MGQTSLTATYLWGKYLFTKGQVGLIRFFSLDGFNLLRLSLTCELIKKHNYKWAQIVFNTQELFGPTENDPELCFNKSKLQTQNSQLICCWFIPFNHFQQRRKFTTVTFWLQINQVHTIFFGNSCLNHESLSLNGAQACYHCHLKPHCGLIAVHLVFSYIFVFFPKTLHLILHLVIAASVICTVEDYCCDANTPLAMAQLPITSPPVARAYEAGTAARAVATAAVAPPVAVRCNGVSWTRE